MNKGENGVNGNRVSPNLVRYGVTTSSNPEGTSTGCALIAELESYINERKSELQAEIQKLEEDAKRVEEMQRLKIHWAVEGVSVTLRKHTDSLTLHVEDCRALLSQLGSLLTATEAVLDSRQVINEEMSSEGTAAEAQQLGANPEPNMMMLNRDLVVRLAVEHRLAITIRPDGSIFGLPHHLDRLRALVAR